ncbi:MAG: efflux RND transporter periplasmic adaptor subunit [Bacteroidetes bacterium]|nr:MAG: efflux RND transporter periplasmic adaptor subunit [Bacteroidota bacterium]
MMKTCLTMELLVLCLLGSMGCRQSAAHLEEPEEISRRTYSEDIQEVDTARAVEGTFYRELLTNGKLEPRQLAELKFRTTGEILEVRVHNGQRVHKGDTLAVLEHFRQQVELEQAQQALEKARLELKDALILQGFTIYKDSVPPEQMKMAENKSGYAQAQSQLRLARRQLEDAFLLAPFSGRIADLQARPFNATTNYEYFCRLIDDRVFEVVFDILEPELAQVKPGQPVDLKALAIPNKTYQGVIREINPQVNEAGMVQVRARVQQPAGLLAGMNVSLSLRQALPQQLIVPKEAVVLRQGREVVFTCVNDTALWNYVTIGLENSRQYTIKEGIQPGDVVIVDGNLNLAHKVPVRVREGSAESH